MKNKFRALLIAGVLVFGITAANAIPWYEMGNWTYTNENNYSRPSAQPQVNNKSNVTTPAASQQVQNKYTEKNVNTPSSATNKSNAATPAISQQELNKYKAEHDSYLSVPKKAAKMEITQLIASHNDGVSGSFDAPINDLGRVELPWYNGNYLAWNTYTGEDDALYFAAEFDDKKYLKGLSVISIGEDSIRVSEYLDSGDWEVPLKSVFIYEPNKKAAFLYDANKNLLMYQINGQRKILNSASIKNPDFMTQVLPKFDNPDKYIIEYKE